MSLPKPDEIPAYEELYEQRPSNFMTGYSNIPNTDPDLESHSHIHLHTTKAQNTPESFQTQHVAEDITSGLEPGHVHCETCDLQLERRERRASAARNCTTVSVTFAALGVCLMIFGIVAVKAFTGHGRRH
ncbi:hypothetical protein N7532_006030 [Penicillium argentinense]|uniref:Uncharacterized protein n=1 Tax=Penicillium argentinense TaxID=1131581 RepID=A0A9W9KAD8_9EURO|nr:uncharacterized protein N7532_006030 [Penicillium argentinense]KAJ5099029.1 hypothetical protein N7532_006030 [Penicillium argentinense]